MAASITATIGGTSSNSYVESVAEAQAFFDSRLNVGAWTDATTDEKTRALIMAARRLNDENYVGTMVNATEDNRQALAWPRYSAYDRDGNSLDHETIPQIVKDAQCELALALLKGGTDDLLADTGLEGFVNVAVGPLNVTPVQGRVAGKLPAHVRRILAPVLSEPAGTIALVRG